MVNAFIRAFAPNLASSDGGSGLTGPDQPYDSGGTPLPYLQNQGGPREYFGNPAPAANVPENNAPVNNGAAVPYMQNQGGPRQYFGGDGLRGVMPPMGGGNNTPPAPAGLASEVPPAQDVLRGPLQRNDPRITDQDFVNGRPPSARIPLTPNNPLSPDDPRMVDQDFVNGTHHSNPSGQLRVPMDPRVAEQRIVEGIHSGRIDPVTRGSLYGAVQDQGPTLGDLITRLNYELPAAFQHLIGGVPRDGLKGRSTPPQADRYLHDVNALGQYPDFNTTDGLAEFNRRMNLNLGPQVRSQREQDALRARGATTTPVSWHTNGRAADIRPRDIGGLTGRAAVEEVRRRLTAAGYQQMEVYWETGHGRHQGTGPHVHIEPPGRPQ